MMVTDDAAAALSKDDYLASIKSDAGKIVVALQADPALPVPACPGWTVGHVAAHVGRAFNWIGEIIDTRAQSPVNIRPDDHSHDPAAPDLPEWFLDATNRFLAAMFAVEADEPIWSWAGDNRAAFWMRLMTHETAVHRWDAQSPLPVQDSIQPKLAADAIDGALGWFLPGLRAVSLLPSRGESYLLRATDAPLLRLIRFGVNTVTVDSDAGDAAVTLCGTASDLLLFLWHRVPAELLEAQGDLAVLRRFFDLAPVP